MSNLQALNRQTAERPIKHPERIVQFGAGNFVRAFADWIIQELNEQAGFDSSVVVVKVTPSGTYQELEDQDGLFHVHLEGIQNGEFVSQTRLITCINRIVNLYDDHEAYLALARQAEIRFLISNTTEAGIQYDGCNQFSDTPPSSFPAKMTRFLYERYRHFKGAEDKACIIIPTELVVDNGSQLRDIILQYAEQWQLDADFALWVEQHNIFCNTLVDRIVPGYPEERSEILLKQLGYKDKLLVMGELYHSWIFEAPDSIRNEFPFEKTTLNIKIVNDANPYRQTKVRILNGLHTSMVPIGYLLGLESVRDCIDHRVLGQFLQDEVYQEIIPSIDLPADELHQFANDVFDRFRNPAIHHRLPSIAVNSSTKVRVRLLPTLLNYYEKYNRLPSRVVFAVAAFIRFYKGEWLGEPIPLSDDDAIIKWIQQQWQNHNSIDAMVAAILRNKALWATDLTWITGLQDQLTQYLTSIDESDLSLILEQINN